MLRGIIRSDVDSPGGPQVDILRTRCDPIAYSIGFKINARQTCAAIGILLNSYKKRLGHCGTIVVSDSQQH